MAEKKKLLTLLRKKDKYIKLKNDFWEKFSFNLNKKEI